MPAKERKSRAWPRWGMRCGMPLAGGVGGWRSFDDDGFAARGTGSGWERAGDGGGLGLRRRRGGSRGQRRCERGRSCFVCVFGLAEVFLVAALFRPRVFFAACGSVLRFGCAGFGDAGFLFGGDELAAGVFVGVGGGGDVCGLRAGVAGAVAAGEVACEGGVVAGEGRRRCGSRRRWRPARGCRGR